MDEDPATATWRAIMRGGLDLAHGSGLEIGPLASPLVAKSEAAITYVDYAAASALRETYRDDPCVDTARIVDIDAVWGARTLAECVDGAQFDYVLASHVAEHVPDLIGWLREVAGVLRPHGELRLVLPDHRFSFDALREETGLVDVLTNWMLRARRPQLHNVLDFRLHYAPAMDAWARYRGHYDLSALQPAHSFGVAVDSAGWVLEYPDRYYDVHCWVFRPRSFACLMAQLAEHGLVQLACTHFVDTAPPRFEFYAFLSPCEDAAHVAASWRAVAAAAHDPLPGSGERRPSAIGEARLEQQLASAEAELAAVRASRSWRVTAPMRWVGQHVVALKDRRAVR